MGYGDSLDSKLQPRSVIINVLKTGYLFRIDPVWACSVHARRRRAAARARARAQRIQRKQARPVTCALLAPAPAVYA
eukprot:COSAG02_NODE_50709_length_318_cov_5.187215_1_plen_76_part_10